LDSLIEEIDGYNFLDGNEKNIVKKFLKREVT
jgi:hypothetical protein